MLRRKSYLILIIQDKTISPASPVPRSSALWEQKSVQFTIYCLHPDLPRLLKMYGSTIFTILHLLNKIVQVLGEKKADGWTLQLLVHSFFQCYSHNNMFCDVIQIHF